MVGLFDANCQRCGALLNDPRPREGTAGLGCRNCNAAMPSTAIQAPVRPSFNPTSGRLDGPPRPLSGGECVEADCSEFGTNSAYERNDVTGLVEHVGYRCRSCNADHERARRAAAPGRN